MEYCPSDTDEPAPAVWLLLLVLDVISSDDNDDDDDVDRQKHSPTWSTADFNVTAVNSTELLHRVLKKHPLTFSSISLENV